MTKKYRLCYIEPESYLAFFTTRSLKYQWGDDWNDAPYEHNAGRPYTSDEKKWDIKTMAFDGNFNEPCSDIENSNYSVERINKGSVAWLETPRWLKTKVSRLYAGATLEEFIKFIKDAGGKVYQEI